MKYISTYIKFILILFVANIALFAKADDGNEQWAMPHISVAHMRGKPAHSAELVSQVLMGMPLKVISDRGDWLEIESPEGYRGWVSGSSLTRLDKNAITRWRKSDRAVVVATAQTKCYENPDSDKSESIVSDLVNGDIVELAGKRQIGGKTEIVLPDGRHAWVNANDICDIDKWAARRFSDKTILDMAYSMLGQPYLWGGTSVKGVDCSGLVKICYLANGIILKRDASQQAVCGRQVNTDNGERLRAGDLLFFGNKETDRVTHVGICVNDNEYIHSSGRVKINSLDPKSKSYLANGFLQARRMQGYEGSEGIIRVKDHPWYF